MATTLSATPGQPVTTPEESSVVPSLSLKTADAPSPDIMRNVLGPNPWEVEDETYAADVNAWRSKVQGQVDQAALDPDAFYKGDDMTFARTTKEAQILATNDAYLSLAYDGETPPAYGLSRDLQRQEIAIARFGGEGADSEEAFHGQVVKEAQGRVDSAALIKDIRGSAALTAHLRGTNFTSSETNAEQRGFYQWKNENKGKPGYDPAKEPDYFETWHQTQRQVAEKIDEFRPQLNLVWKAFEDKQDYGAAAATVWKSLPEDQRKPFLAALKVRSQELSQTDRDSFGMNFFKSTVRGLGGLADDARIGSVDAVQRGGTIGWEDFLGSDSALHAKQQRDRTSQKDFRDRENFRASIIEMQQQTYDPIRYLAPDDSWAQRGEKIVYGTPAVFASSAAAIFAPPVLAASLNEYHYRSLRQRLLDSGQSEEQADANAAGMAPIAAGVEFLSERLGAELLLGKMPFLNKAINGVTDKLTSAAARFGVRFAAGGTQEGLQEVAQNYIDPLVVDVANALGQDLPDVQWLGKGGEFDGDWSENVDTFLAVLPLAIFGAAGGISRDARARAFQTASTTELIALGIDADGIAAINAANGLASANAAVDAAMETRNPNSPEAKLAVQALAAKQTQTQAAQESLDRLGYAQPRFVQSVDGITVFDGETGDPLGDAPDMAGAIKIARAATTALDDLTADQVGYLGSMFEAARAATEIDPNSIHDMQLGESFDPAQASPEMAARFAAQVALKEQAEGGTGDIARSVLGYSVTSFAQGMRTTINSLFRGSSVTDVFHETFHGLRRQALAAGTLTRADELAVLRGLDTIFGGRTTKDGTALRFIPENMTDEQVSDTLIAEAISEIAEMEVLRTRKGEGKGKLGISRGVISRNLTALAKIAPGAAAKFASFIAAVRARWGLSLSRAMVMKKAQRDGSFDASGYDAFLDKLLGLDQQTEHDAGVQSEFDRILALPEDMEDDDIPFSIGRSTVTPTAETQTFQGAEGSPSVIGPAAFSIAAFHGTPHKIEGRMTTDKIGTGEGAQVYGYGLYFAAERKIAEYYRKILGSEFRLDGETLLKGGQLGPKYQELRAALGEEASDIVIGFIDEGKARVIDELNDTLNNIDSETFDKALDYLDRIEATESGNLYSVTLDVDHADLLDWDAPLSSTPAVLAKVDAMDNPLLARAKRNGRDLGKMTARDLLDAMGGDPRGTAQALKEAGIPGIRYLDGNSRADGDGSRNFVIFDDSKIQITEENGTPVDMSQKLEKSNTSSERVAGSDSSFSIGPAQVADIMGQDAISRITDPRRRTAVMKRIARDYNNMRLQIDRIASLSGFKRSKADMRNEANAREDLAAEEKIGAIHVRYGSLLADDDLVRVKAQPVHAFLSVTRADGSVDPLHGRLMSKAQAIKTYPDLYQLHRAGDYDGSEDISRTVFGGILSPTQAANHLFDNWEHGQHNPLISEPTPDAMWDALAREAASVKGMKDLLEKARQEIREAKAEAKREANEWLATQSQEQETVFNDKEEIRRSLRMLDAILLALPSEIRGKLGGYTQISMISTDDAKLSFLKDKLAKADVELEKFLRLQYDAEFDDLMRRASPAQNEPGMRPTGSIAADAYDILRAANEARALDFSKGEALADYWETIAENDDTPPHEAELAGIKAQMIRLTANWTKADAARREQAVDEAEKIYYGGLAALAKDNSARRERLKKLRTSAITGTGKTGHRMERMAAEQEAKGNKLKSFKQFAWEFMSFGQVVNTLFGENSDAAKWFNAKEISASNAAHDGFQAKANGLEALMQRLAGSRFGGEALRHKMATVQSIKATDLLGVEHTFSDSEAITFLLMWRQEDGKRHMEGIRDEAGNLTSEWGWDQDAADAVEAGLSPAGHAVMSHLSQSYGEEYGRINEVFRRIWKVSMPRHKMYAPLSVAPVQGKADSIIDPESGDAMGTGMTPGSLKNRSASAIAEPLFKDAFQTFLIHARQMEHFIAYGEFARDALGVVNRRETRNAIAAAGGPYAAGQLSKWIDYFAQGGIQDAAMGGFWSKAFGSALGRLSQAALVGRASVLVMQSLQLMAASYRMPLGSFLTRLVKLQTGQLGWKDAINSDYIQRRLAAMPPVVRDMVKSLGAGKPNRAKYAAGRASMAISGADALFTAGTYAIFYDYARTNGLTEEDAHTEAERLTDQVAQPTRAGARSWLEISMQAQPAFRAMWNFSSDPRQKVALAVYEFMRRDKSGLEKAGSLGKSVALTWLVSGVLATLLRAMMRDLRNDDDKEIFDERYWNPKQLALMAATGPLGAVPFLGGMIEDSTYSLTGQYHPQGGLLDGLSNAAAIPKKWSKGKVEPLKDIETATGAAATVSGTAAAAASAMHLIRDMAGALENLEGPD